MQTAAPVSDLTYIIHLQLKHKAAPGTIMGISGNIEELGFWKKFDIKMKWTKGDIWVSDEIVTKKRFFQYKYLKMGKDGQLISWERGCDRILDCDILPEIVDGHNHGI